ncbi:zinc finger protein 614-like [Ceratina calcarata]|uniref:Zinc finger protein 614-like n=1 Tax=Ceratina calcarata TaxID=156304 RepID=A0AAJ7J4L5_9HYME|nr:zinc finger protein 614-like [Ceratina calcarata]XP_017884044.1 zinc finger protein 614-like [Ceratina calcarata]
MELGEGEAQICRLCGQCESIYIDIFGEEGTKRLLGLKIHKKINILIKENDGLPQTVCMRCCATLEFFDDFYEQCHLTQQNLLKASQNGVEKRINEDDELESDKENAAPPMNRNTNVLYSRKNKRLRLQTDNNCADTEDTMKPNNENSNEALSTNNEKNVNLKTTKSLKRKVDDTSQEIIVRTSLKDTKSSENVNINLEVPVRRKRGRKSNLEKMREAVTAANSKNQIQSDLCDKFNETCKNYCTNTSNCVTNNAVISCEPQVVEAKKQITAVDTSSKQKDGINNILTNKLIESHSSNTENQISCNAKNKSPKSKAISVIVKQEKGDVEINNLIKKNKNKVETITPLTEETVRPESNKTDLASEHDLITSPVAETSDRNNKEVFKEQNRVTVIKCSRSNEILNPEVTREDSVVIIDQSIKSDLDGSLTDDSLSRKSSQGSSSEIRRKDKFGKLSELISDEQKQTIETYYTVNMSVINEEEVQRHITIVDKKSMRCNICGNLYLRMDKCQVHVWGHLQMKPYQCKACKFSTVTVTNVRCHIRKSHLKIKPFVCHLCEKRYVTGVLLKEHLNSHTGARPYKCNVCDYTCSNRQILSYHSNIHKPVKDVSCEICSKQFYSKGRLRSHMSIHNRSKFVMCKLCSAYLSNAEALESHHKNVHAQDYVCNVCGKCVKSKKALNNHQNVHAAAKYKCTICPNVYKNSQVLKEHLLKHEGIRKYECKVCSKNFGQQSHLAAHMAVHSKIRFHCPGCDKPFNRHDNMKIHTKRCKSFQKNPELKNLLLKRDRTISFNNASESTTNTKLKSENDNDLLNNVKTEQGTAINLCTLDLNISCIKKSDNKWNGDNIRNEAAVAKSSLQNAELIPHNENMIVLENILAPESY